ncbi:uncharacterized protein LOC120586309 [Pteropus medius]|uniref:uncharacterized protein LOC120586309 n=1 Tax=Pteropus vampyrus TaxID=132908 RepID=UPI00196B3BD7|nr:uncharacterized protein LOC120586309 [Pteropus giganteus]
MNLNLRQCRETCLWKWLQGLGTVAAPMSAALQGPSPPEGRWPSVGGQLALGDLCRPLLSALHVGRMGTWPRGWPLVFAPGRGSFVHGAPQGPAPGSLSSLILGTCCGRRPAGLGSHGKAATGCTLQDSAQHPHLEAARTSVATPSPRSPAVVSCPHRGRVHAWATVLLPAVCHCPRLSPACVLLRTCSCFPSNHTNSASCLRLQGQVQGDHVSVAGCDNEAWPSHGPPSLLPPPRARAWPWSALWLCRGSSGFSPSPMGLVVMERSGCHLVPCDTRGVWSALCPARVPQGVAASQPSPTPLSSSSPPCTCHLWPRLTPLVPHAHLPPSVTSWPTVGWPAALALCPVLGGRGRDQQGGQNQPALGCFSLWPS